MNVKIYGVLELVCRVSFFFSSAAILIIPVLDELFNIGFEQYCEFHDTSQGVLMRPEESFHVTNTAKLHTKITSSVYKVDETAYFGRAPPSVLTLDTTAFQNVNSMLDGENKLRRIREQASQQPNVPRVCGSDEV